MRGTTLIQPFWLHSLQAITVPSGEINPILPSDHLQVSSAFFTDQSLS